MVVVVVCVEGGGGVVRVMPGIGGGFRRAAVGTAGTLATLGMVGHVGPASVGKSYLY